MAALLAVAWLAVMASPAYAYIDPGTGSYAFQITIAALLSGLIFIRQLWRRILRFLHKGDDTR